MSADSMAWSFAARRQPFSGSCGRRSCSNCLHYALEWRRRLLNRLQTFRPGARGAMLPPLD